MYFVPALTEKTFRTGRVFVVESNIWTGLKSANFRGGTSEELMALLERVLEFTVPGRWVGRFGIVVSDFTISPSTFQVFFRWVATTNYPADCFPRVWVHDFIKRKTVVNIINMWKFSWFCNIAI